MPYLLQSFQHNLSVCLKGLEFDLIMLPAVWYDSHQTETYIMIWLPAKFELQMLLSFMRIETIFSHWCGQQQKEKDLRSYWNHSWHVNADRVRWIKKTWLSIHKFATLMWCDLILTYPPVAMPSLSVITLRNFSVHSSFSPHGPKMKSWLSNI